MPQRTVANLLTQCNIYVAIFAPASAGAFFAEKTLEFLKMALTNTPNWRIIKPSKGEQKRKGSKQ